jgi:hypothetical protein
MLQSAKQTVQLVELAGQYAASFDNILVTQYLEKTNLCVLQIR